MRTYVSCCCSQTCRALMGEARFTVGSTTLLYAAEWSCGTLIKERINFVAKGSQRITRSELMKNRAVKGRGLMWGFRGTWFRTVLPCQKDEYSCVELWIMAPYGILRRLALVATYVPKERMASIIRVRRIGELGKLAVTSNRSTIWRNTTTLAATSKWSNLRRNIILLYIWHFFAPCSGCCYC
jgi:hypothetical protein